MKSYKGQSNLQKRNAVPRILALSLLLIGCGAGGSGGGPSNAFKAKTNAVEPLSCKTQLGFCESQNGRDTPIIIKDGVYMGMDINCDGSHAMEDPKKDGRVLVSAGHIIQEIPQASAEAMGLLGYLGCPATDQAARVMDVAEGNHTAADISFACVIWPNLIATSKSYSQMYPELANYQYNVGYEEDTRFTLAEIHGCRGRPPSSVKLVVYNWIE